MPRDVIRTGDAPSSPYFSQAMRGAGLVFVSGQPPFDPATGEVVGASIQEQTRQCLANVRAILTAAGSGLDKVVSATFILAEASRAKATARWISSTATGSCGARTYASAIINRARAAGSPSMSAAASVISRFTWPGGTARTGCPHPG
jgi:2-iminobutanoate/2-iminopropanoate deaminase